MVADHPPALRGARRGMGQAELEETKIGRLDHKIEKLRLVKRVARRRGHAHRGAHRRRRASASSSARPWGVVGMVAARDALGPHPGQQRHQRASPRATPPSSARTRRRAKIAARALQALQPRDRGARPACRTRSPAWRARPSSRAEELFRHPDVALLCVTGGPAVVKAAHEDRQARHRGRPRQPARGRRRDAPTSTAAARASSTGASFDNNLLCIGEKEVFVVEPSVADASWRR